MENKDGIIQHNSSMMGASFYIMLENRIAIAEMSFIDKQFGKGYLEMIEEGNTSLLNQTSDCLEKSDGVLFFNRLNVPPAFRNSGYGQQLLQACLNFCKENNYFLINTASNYGEMGQKSLIEFYQKGNMLLVHPDGLLIYHSGIDNSVQIKPKNKLK